MLKLCTKLEDRDKIIDISSCLHPPVTLLNMTEAANMQLWTPSNCTQCFTVIHIMLTEQFQSDLEGKLDLALLHNVPWSSHSCSPERGCSVVGRIGRGVRPYLVREVPRRWPLPVFEIFNPTGCPFYGSPPSHWPPFSAKQNWFVSITFNYRDRSDFFICYFTVLSILFQFSPWCLIQLTPFFMCLRSFGPLIFGSIL